MTHEHDDLASIQASSLGYRPLTREAAWWNGEAPLCPCGEPLSGGPACPACQQPTTNQPDQGGLALSVWSTEQTGHESPSPQQERTR